MKLFSDEIINIGRIVSIESFDTHVEMKDLDVINYNPCLPFYELIISLSGENNVYFNGVQLHDNPGVVRYLPKNAYNGEYRVEKLEAGVCIDIYFDTDSPMPKEAIEIRNMQELCNSFVKIYNIWSKKKAGYYSKCMAIFYEIIGEIMGKEAKYVSPDKKEKLLRAQDYIMKNLSCKKFDFIELSRVTGLSYSYFKTLFIDKYGIPPVKYLCRMRIERAKELLVLGRYSIGQIADMCGFESLYYFSSVFKRMVGVSPKKYIG